MVSRGNWLGKPENIKVRNNDAAGYVGSSLTLHIPLLFVHKLCTRCAPSGPKKLTKTYNKGRFPNHSALIKYVKTKHNIEDIEGKVNWLTGIRQDEMPYSDD